MSALVPACPAGAGAPFRVPGQRPNDGLEVPRSPASRRRTRPETVPGLQVDSSARTPGSTALGPVNAALQCGERWSCVVVESGRMTAKNGRIRVCDGQKTATTFSRLPLDTRTRMPHDCLCHNDKPKQGADMNKDVRAVLESAKAQGFTVVATAGNHYEVYSPDGRKVTTFAGTPSDSRSTKNACGPLRAAGWQDPKRPQKKKGAR